MDKITDALVCTDCWVLEKNRPRQCEEMKCCCLNRGVIIEDTPELGLAIISLLMFVLYTDCFGKVYYLLGC